MSKEWNIISACQRQSKGVIESISITPSEQNEDNPSRKGDMAPAMPRIASVHFLALNLPTTELLIQPPPIRAIAHLDISQPFADNRHDSGVQTYTHT